MSQPAFINDPQPLVFFAGHWHFYYLFNKDYPNGNGTEWKHAISTNLVDWQDAGVAMEKYKTNYGDPWSGSIVVDQFNTANFGKNALIALCTMSGLPEVGQSTARWVSRDQGRTFQFDKIVMEPSSDSPPSQRIFRDPRLLWLDAKKKWLMVISEHEKIGFYESKDLAKWSYLSSFFCNTLGVLECPCLFPMIPQTASGKFGREKWILMCSANGYQMGLTTGTYYWLGSFDGKQFTADQPKGQWLDAGPDFYATAIGARTNVSSIAQEQYYAVAWINNWEYAKQVTKAGYYGGYTKVRAISLRQEDQTFRLYNSLLWDGKPFQFDQVFGRENRLRALTPDNPVVIPAVSSPYCCYLAFSQSESTWPDQIDCALASGTGTPIQLSLMLARNQIVLSRQQSGFTPVNEAAWQAKRSASIRVAKRITMLFYVTQHHVEIIINDGEVSMTALVFPNNQSMAAKLSVTGGRCYLDQFGIDPLTA